MTMRYSHRLTRGDDIDQRWPFQHISFSKFLTNYQLSQMSGTFFSQKEIIIIKQT